MISALPISDCLLFIASASSQPSTLPAEAGPGSLDLVFAFLSLAFGIAMLILGGDTLVKGASEIAERLGVSPLIVGLTVVAFGTSAPELAVNMTAAFNGNTGVSFGNIIGSNIANIGLIIGVCALVKPLVVQKSIITREIPIMLFASVVVMIMSMKIMISDFTGIGPYAKNIIYTDFIGMWDGIALLSLFAMFLLYTIRTAIKQRAGDVFLDEVEERETQKSRVSIPLAIIFFLLGLVNVVIGGSTTVDGAITVAQSFNVSEAIIGLTIVAIGTSLPELATGVMAVRKGHTDIAVGNAIGSNIFNLLFILGPTAIVANIPVPYGGHFDLIFMLVLSIAVLPLAITGQRTITRIEGGVLLAFYLGFIGLRSVVM